ncbi:META domain-containing protein, partial [uncultured Muribaculum sp.]|uniref:META domain-containing protein n=1 Tax=uncultured Muribaculum sp. TaxID=1918613 RepID=UPI0025AE5069
VFEDSTYFIKTNCNTISGTYTIKGDSIILGDGAMTEMACDNMAVEDALRRILPNIATVYIQNDSIARLDSRNPSEYIVPICVIESRSNEGISFAGSKYSDDTDRQI